MERPWLNRPSLCFISNNARVASYCSFSSKKSLSISRASARSWSQYDGYLGFILGGCKGFLKSWSMRKRDEERSEQPLLSESTRSLSPIFYSSSRYPRSTRGSVTIGSTGFYLNFKHRCCFTRSMFPLRRNCCTSVLPVEYLSPSC